MIHDLTRHTYFLIIHAGFSFQLNLPLMLHRIGRCCIRPLSIITPLPMIPIQVDIIYHCLLDMHFSVGVGWSDEMGGSIVSVYINEASISLIYSINATSPEDSQYRARQSKEQPLMKTKSCID